MPLPHREAAGTAPFKSGRVAILGKPNVGKSTLLNGLTGAAIAITASKPETTRQRIVGVAHRPGGQVAFVDTPGIHRPRVLLGAEMVRAAKAAVFEVDLVLFVADAFGLTSDDAVVLAFLRTVSAPAIAVINKVDLVAKPRLLPLIDHLARLARFVEIVPISALEREHLERLWSVLLRHLPAGEAMYPAGMVTTESSRALVAESVREQVIRQTSAEVPHATAVVIEEMVQRSGRAGTRAPWYIRATIYVEREAQRVILIGAGGAMLKRIGQASRRRIEALVHGRVFLELWVKALPNWRRDPGALRRFGYLGSGPGEGGSSARKTRGRPRGPRSG